MSAMTPLYSLIESTRYAGPLFMMGVILSSCHTAWTIHHEKTVRDLPLLPFLSLFVNCTLWTLYGLLKNDMTLLVPNITGSLAGLACTAVYYTYTSFASQATQYRTAACLLCLASFLFCTDESNLLGVLSCSAAVVLMGSPLSAVFTVIRNKSTASLPLGTSLSMTLNSASWATYGWFIAGDVFVYLPNLIALVLCAFQLSLYVVFGLPPRFNKVLHSSSDDEGL